MFKITQSNRFKKDFRKLVRSGRFNLQHFHTVINRLASGLELSPRYKDHQLKGELKAFRECHLDPTYLFERGESIIAFPL